VEAAARWETERVVDVCFSEPRLAELYDVLDGERDDLGLYGSLASEMGATSVLDLGCGTGTLPALSQSRGSR
jgi:methylase of polypeptide subunit release factors